MTPSPDDPVPVVAYLQIGLGEMHDGTVIARIRPPGDYNPDWWRFENLVKEKDHLAAIAALQEQNNDLRELLDRKFGAGWEDFDAAHLRQRDRTIAEQQARIEELCRANLKLLAEREDQP
jgi:hypothetical protein